ncbi:MAG: hypothetical protein RSB51_00810 [Clostridia bacterium]
MKKGSAAITVPITTAICMIMIAILFINIINYIIPFIWYEKLQIICQKYTYVIEQFGYLKVGEIDDLKTELKRKGFKLENITFKIPEEEKEYGSLFEFSVKYMYEHETIGFGNGGVVSKKNNIPIVIEKYGYVKK